MRAFAMPSLAVLISLVAALPAQAALPPQYQRQAELLAIINDEAVIAAFGFGGIESIAFEGVDHYVVRGGDCRLDVTIKDLPNKHEGGWAGPREFTLALGEPVCGTDSK